MQIEEKNPNYPRWAYNAKHPKGLLVHSEDEFERLKGEWFSMPDLRESSRVLGQPLTPEPEARTAPKKFTKPVPPMSVSAEEPKA